MVRAASSTIEPDRARTVTGTGIQPIVAAIGRTTTNNSMPAVGRTTTGSVPREIESIDGRTLGSELILPANPLMNLTDESLEGFIDCTIYEETANFFEDTAEELQDLPIATSRTRTASMLALAEPLQLDRSDSEAAAADDAVASSSTAMPAFAPARQTSSIQPFTPPPSPRTATSEIPSLARTVTGEITAIGVPVGVGAGLGVGVGVATPVPDLPRAVTAELPYPYATPGTPGRVATGNSAAVAGLGAPARTGGEIQSFKPREFVDVTTAPDFAAVRPSGDPASLVPAQTVSGDIAPAYPQTFRADIVDAHAPPVVWPAPAERTAISRGVRHRRTYLVAAIAALSLVLLVMIIVAATRGDSAEAKAATAPTSRPTSVPRPTTQAVTEPPAAHAVTPSKTTATTIAPATTTTTKGAATASHDSSSGDAGDDSAPAPNGPPVVGTGPCRVIVTTTPAASIVSVDGNAVGPSPLTVATACQRVRIDVAHPRYQSQMRLVALAVAKPASIDVTLPRPTHAVSVLTLPPGAEVKIDGRRAGVTPTVVQMLGFTSVDLTIEKAGYQTLTKRVYSKLPQDRVFVKMSKKP